MGQVEEMAEGDEGVEPLRELREAGAGKGCSPGPQGRQPVQLEIVEPPDPVCKLPHEQGTQERRNTVQLDQLQVGEVQAFFIPGQPVPAPRMQVGRYGAYYKTKAYPDWLEMARDYVRRKWPAPMIEEKVPLEVSFRFYVRRSNTHWGTGKNRNRVRPRYLIDYPFPRGDFDNLAKGAADALTGVAYADDAQIVVAHVDKQFTETRDDEPGVRIDLATLKPIEPSL